MSRCATRAELAQVIRDTISSDHNRQSRLGLPTDPAAYSMPGIIRDLQIIGDATYGYTPNTDTPLVEILRSNVIA